MKVTVIDVLSALFSGMAALGGVVAVIVAVRALTIAREAASVEQLFIATGDVLAALQEVGRLGSRLGGIPDGAAQSRTVVAEAFERFLAARARVELCLEALGLAGEYPDSVLNLANNYAAGVLQADEFAEISQEISLRDLQEDDWVTELSWKPSGPDVQILARSASFQEVRHSIDLVPDGVTRLEGLDRWWGDRILEHGSYGHARSVYSIDASYLTQTSRLVDDFTREYVQPLFSRAVRQVARSRRRMKPLS